MANPSSDWYDYLEHAEASDVGMRRPNNQDAHAVVLAADKEQWARRGHVFVVADGMGAHAAGELASQLAVQNIPRTYHELTDVPEAAAIEQSIVAANLVIYSQGQTSASCQGMGTTCVVLVLLPDGALVAHVGDSRAYRLRYDRIEQLTFDHSLYWEMMAATEMSEDQAPVTVPKNVITRSLGPNPTVEVDLEGPFPVEMGDRYLLCSDGLTGLVRDDEIGMILSGLSIPEAVQTLVDLANLRGGSDNITIVAVGIGPRQDPDARRSAAFSAGAGSPGRRLQAVIWTIAGVCLVGAAVALATALWLPAACLLAGCLVATVVGWLRIVRPARPSTVQLKPPRLGRGPHRVSDCRPTRRLVDLLARDVFAACQTAKDAGGAIDWAQVEICRRGAEEAVRSGRLSDALVHSARSARLVARQLQRKQHPPSDNVDFE